VISNLNRKYCISSEDVLKSTLSITNKTKNNYQVGDYVILLFSKLLLEYLIKRVKMQPEDWLAPYHPYASNPIYNGNFDGISISAIMPPMGASPIASVAEDLITCGAKTLLLVCGAWGIAKNVNLLDFLIPTHALGPDGTSIYYGRKADDITLIDKEIVNIISNEVKKKTSAYHIGKNYSMEAFYKIDVKQAKNLQNNGFISMENGELNTLAFISNMRDMKFGALFYSYYNLLEGWRVPWLQKEYQKRVELEGLITLESIKRIDNEKY
jgi:uridine phosphorylase